MKPDVELALLLLRAAEALAYHISDDCSAGHDQPTQLITDLLRRAREALAGKAANA